MGALATAARGVAGRPHLLLINPRFPESFWSFRWAVDRVLPGKRALNPPLGLATLAALTLPDWEVEIVDENVEPLPLDTCADIVGVCGMAMQFPRQSELLRYYRSRGHHVVAGGSYASLCPERFEGLADTVVAGEAEYTWPRFCADYVAGRPGQLYRETGVVDLAHSPTPRFDLLRLERYATVALQFSRGCPYRCEFCDIIVMFGRRPRTKSVEQIGRELDRLRELGAHNVFFVDDNLIGHSRKARELLAFLAAYQRRHAYPFQFGTEASINMAEDDELLGQFRAAGFAWVFIGIETPDPQSLRETGKTQNMRGDLLASVRRIYTHGIDVLAGFIVGFDNDTLETFERQYRFIHASGIQVAMVGLLTALPSTPLHERLRREGRLLEGGEHADNTRAGTNFIPRRMSYDAMVEAYRHLYHRLLRDRCIAGRIRNKMRHLRSPVYRGGYRRREAAGIVWRLLARGILPGGPARWCHFLYTLIACVPRGWPQVVSDWISALALREYARHHLGEERGDQERILGATINAISTRFSACLRRGSLHIARTTGTGATRDVRLEVALRGVVERGFFGQGGRHLERLLRRTRATLSLRIEALATGQRGGLERLLRRLARHGDRVSIHVSRPLRDALHIDSSVFHLVLDEN